MRNLVLGIMFLGLAGCYQKYLVMQAEVVSMTEKHAGSKTSLNLGNEITEQWCMGDQPLYQPQEKDIGLVDQVIYKAQKNNQADFITEARIFRDSKGCAFINGRLARLQ